MKIGRFATQFQYSVIALALMSVCLSRAQAQDGHSQALAPQHHGFSSTYAAREEHYPDQLREVGRGTDFVVQSDENKRTFQL